ncbi:7410_t:CDS:2, partial [Scutellospora calospora]
MEDSDNSFYYDIASKLDFAKYEIKMIEYGGKTVKLKILIDQAVIKGLILYHNIDFLLYSPNTSPTNTKNEELSKYFWYWCAYLVQQPSKKPGTIQARKLIVMNETSMSSGDWNKYNDHFKSLITEDYLTIERKGIKPKVIKDYARFIVLSNVAYFKNLVKVLEHSNMPNIIMAYLLSLDISDWNQQDIPATKMKTDI